MERIVALDFDNVLADTTAHMCHLINKEHGKKFSKEDIIEWAHMQKLMNWSETQELEMFEKVWLDDNLPPTEPNLSKIIKHIKETLNCRISIITARTPNSVVDPVKWLSRHNIEYDDYIGIVTKRSKEDFPWDILIDDGIHNIESVRSPRIGILYAQPWNSKFEDYLYKVNKLSDVTEILRVKSWIL